jgi:hypothetical protein
MKMATFTDVSEVIGGSIIRATSFAGRNEPEDIHLYADIQ